MTQKSETQPGAAGLANLSLLGDFDNREINPNPHTNQVQSSGARRPRRRYLVAKLHALGPAPLAHFVAEIEAGADINATLEQYARLPADFVRAYGGNEFAAPFIIDGGRL